MSVDLSWWKRPPPLLEDCNTILSSYIINPQIPIHDPPLNVLPRQSNIGRLYFTPPGTISTTIVPERDLQTGEILNFVEVDIEDAESTARNSMSFKRAPGPPESATRGSAVNYPFWPGGFDEPAHEIATLSVENLVFENDLLTIAPGFAYGLNFDQLETKNKGKELNDEVVQNNFTVDLLSIVEQEHNILGLWPTETGTEAIVKVQSDMANVEVHTTEQELIELPEKIKVLTISETKEVIQCLEWAEMIDTTNPVKDFSTKVQNPARKYNFELDIFQKQAIIKLEEHNHVFVAAHTSAGKTVVAEYAIALSQRHMTRTIYTSPIKALSNQKYRDFKNEFKDVGLITGDIQIDPTSSCLIMTTEILRSMLYGGSEVTRDLEYVIFDEVHYITDPDRGHVWEEVLILLPDQVTIVMLSATVPNKMEFANWVGLTKKRKVYVISTNKRPVPLMHYLYTGSGGKSKDNCYLLVNDVNEFKLDGYEKAKQSLTIAKEKNAGANKSGVHKRPHQKMPIKADIPNVDNGDKPNINRTEQNTWIGLVDFLKRNKKMPVVAFTLSRKRCDRYLQTLSPVDLCTSSEAGHIHSYFQRCLQRLKPEDRNIPQVIILQDSLKRGIGVHHSGILPILKEIVEILFQSGYVKLLFATETFAMGVNMPARTVIFDSHRKYDGIESRDLLPSEYTQMAGRAGRRGLDDTGTVMLMCKYSVPPEVDLKRMILHTPKGLNSKFRLTYAMILNLLRVEIVSVEDMMSHSFMEFGSQIKIPEEKEKLKQLEGRLATLPNLGEHLEPFSKFYDIAYEYIQLRGAFMSDLTVQQKISKEIKPGCVMIITHKNHYNKLAIVLAVIPSVSKGSTYKVLVLDDQNVGDSSKEVQLATITDKQQIKEKSSVENDSLWHRMISFTPQQKHYTPEGIGHNVLTITSIDIVDITKTTLKIEADKLIQNWDQRQIPRFKDTPPGPTFIKTVTELYNLNNTVNSGETKLQLINLKKELKLTINLEKISKVKSSLDGQAACTNVPNFKLEFIPVFERKKTETQLKEKKFKTSFENMSLYPEYMQKLDVLKYLNYIDEQHQVTMKGRVACEMGSNELIITELVLCNTFNDLEPPEIAALLSSLVFQATSDSVPNLTDNLKKCIMDIREVDGQIDLVERKFITSSIDESKNQPKNEIKKVDNSTNDPKHINFVDMNTDRLNFGLVEVVYEWARNKSFAEIMKMTDVQEGIIVRCIQQLNETIQDVQDAARIIGNPTLHKKMEEASNAIKRDIVFAASLYLQT